YLRTGRYDEAVRTLREALDIDQRILGDHAVVAGDLANLSIPLREQNKFDEAEQTLVRAQAIADRVSVPPITQIAIDTSYGNLWALQGDPKRSLLYFQKAYEVWTRPGMMRGPDITATVLGIAEAELDLNDLVHAQQHFEEARDIAS